MQNEYRDLSGKVSGEEYQDSSYSCDSIGLVHPRSRPVQLSRNTFLRKAAETIITLEALKSVRHPFGAVNLTAREQNNRKTKRKNTEKTKDPSENDSLLHELATILDSQTFRQREIQSPTSRFTVIPKLTTYYTPRSRARPALLHSNKAASTQLSPRDQQWSLPILSAKGHYQRQLFSESRKPPFRKPW